MKKLFAYPITAPGIDEVACWVVSLALLVVCTLLGLWMLPDLQPASGVLVASALVVGWGVMAWQGWVVTRRRISRAAPRQDV
jgi:hypothetical protein